MVAHGSNHPLLLSYLTHGAKRYGAHHEPIQSSH